MSNYSKDVFFLPWVGDNYANGWKLQNNKITNAGNNGDFCVMVTGEEGYCTKEYVQDRNNEEKILFTSTQYNNPKQCTMNLGFNNCANLMICKNKTINMVHAHIQNKFDRYKQKKNGLWPHNAKSMSKFEKEFYKNILTPNKGKIGGDERRQIWNYLLFNNFFQCGVRSQDEGYNKNLRNLYSKKSYDAFISILTIHKPHIVFVMGKNTKKVINNNLCINMIKQEQDNMKCVSFSNTNYLLVFIPHSSPRNRNLNNDISILILTAFKFAQNLRQQKLL